MISICRYLRFSYRHGTIVSIFRRISLIHQDKEPRISWVCWQVAAFSTISQLPTPYGCLLPLCFQSIPLLLVSEEIYHIIANKCTVRLWNHRKVAERARAGPELSNPKSDHFNRVLVIFVKIVRLFHKNGSISTKNAPVFNRKQLLESSELFHKNGSISTKNQGWKLQTVRLSRTG